MVTAKRSADGGLPTVELARDGAPDACDGRLPDGGVRASEKDLPGITKLDPALRSAVRLAAGAAARDGIVVRITSGWRSRRYQQELLDQAIVTHGSREEALRFVALPDESRHVTGDAVDIGPTDAVYWFAQHGPDFGLCQTFANEVWHYELLADPYGNCPEMRADSAS